MEIFKILQKKSNFFYAFLIILGITNGLWNNALLLVINNRINNVPLPYFNQHVVWVFVSLIVLSYLVSRYFSIYMLRLTMDLSYEMGLIVFDKLRFTSYEEFNRFGREKIYALMSDTQTVCSFPSTFIEVFNAFVIFVVGMVYLAYISPVGALTVFGVLFFLAGIYYYHTKIAEKYMVKTRALADAYHKSIIDMLGGFKEMKMSTIKNDNIFSALNRNRLSVKALNEKTSIKWLNNDLMGRYSWYILFGVILFLLPEFYNLQMQKISSFLITLLFLIGPIGTLISVIPSYTNIKIALNKLQQFDQEINSSLNLQIRHGEPLPRRPAFSSIRFKDIQYNYFIKGIDYSFSISVPDLEIVAGETLFITGGNGTGKSTFVNILTGLFIPAEGQILLDDHLIRPENYPDYRNQISAIFSDNFLFSENYESYLIHDENPQLLYYIDLMHLNDIVRINNEKNRLELELSKGQQKRLAMIYALMENKDILVLDEWAADQDPGFRLYFYSVFLPDLKKRGKTVIAVTHDDAYFKYADRVIKFDGGEIVKDERNNISQVAYIGHS